MKRGQVYPHQAARALLNPLRRLIVSPQALVRWMNVGPDAAVLELGCGPGYFSPALARATSAGVVVLFDLQGEMLAMARDRVRGAGVAFAVQGDALALPFATASVDVVLMVTVLGETGSPAMCLREIGRVLRPNGRLVIVEQRGDPDRIARDEIVALAATAGLTLARERRGRLGLSHVVELVAGRALGA